MRLPGASLFMHAIMRHHTVSRGLMIILLLQQARPARICPEFPNP